MLLLLRLPLRGQTKAEVPAEAGALLLSSALLRRRLLLLGKVMKQPAVP